jgi:hypothetical protein
MKRNLNKTNQRIFEKFLIDQNTGSTHEEVNGIISIDLFKSLEEKKTIIGYLENIGLDPFKRVTREPERIRIALSQVSWEQIKNSPKVGRSMFD